MSEKYLIDNWLAYVQQIQHLLSRGYTEYCMGEYPIEKKDKFEKIDQKLIEKYNANLNKDKTHYRKRKKIANFRFLRCQHNWIILKTKGSVEKNITVDDVFFDIKKSKIEVTKLRNEQDEFKLSNWNTTLLIGYNGKESITVYMNKETYRTVKLTCFEYIEQKKYAKAIHTFNNLNALPAWGGIVEQKIKMKDQLIRKMEKHLAKEKVKPLANQLKINTKRTAKKVFD